MFKDKKVTKDMTTRFMGTLFENEGKYGSYYVASLAEGEYEQGQFYFVDNTTQKTYRVKSFVINEAKSDKIAGKLTIDISSPLCVEEVKQ